MIIEILVFFLFLLMLGFLLAVALGLVSGVIIFILSIVFDCPPEQMVDRFHRHIEERKRLAREKREDKS